jgi:dihydroorotase
VKEGAVAFKLFMADQVGGLNVEDDNAILDAFRIVSKFNTLVAVHAEDKTTLRKAEEKLKRAKRDDIKAFLEAHSEDVETKAVKRILNIVKQTNTHVRFCHISTKGGLNAIINGKKSGLPVVCETTPHHLLLSVDDFEHAETLALTVPPLRQKNNVLALWRAIKNGWVDIFASDHAPHTIEEKRAANVWAVKVGIPNLETMLPLFLTEAKRGRLSIGDIVKFMAEKPSELFQLKGKGFLKKGNEADLTVIDLNGKYKIDAAKFCSKAKYSPFDQWRVEGKPVKTFVNGRLIMDEGEIVAKPSSGKVIRR